MNHGAAKKTKPKVPHQTLRTPDQHQNHQCKRQDGRELAQGPTPEAPRRSDGQGLQQPQTHGGREGSSQRAHAAHHQDNEHHRAHGGGHAGLGHERVSTHHTGRRGQGRADAEHPAVNLRYVVPQGLHRLRVRHRSAHDQTPMRATPEPIQAQQHGHSHAHQHHTEHGELCAPGREPMALQGVGQHHGHRAFAPHQLHQLKRHISQTKGDQELGHVALRMHAAQHALFKPRTQHADQERRDQQRAPKTQERRQAVRRVSTQHVKAGVCKVEHAHEAVDERQARTEHEEQQPMAQAVEQ